jgi:hypothetical protein
MDVDANEIWQMEKILKIYRMFQEERSILWEIRVSAIVIKKTYVHVSYSERFPRYRYFTVQFQNCWLEILHTVSNTGIYCSSDKVGTVYLV